MKYLQQPTLNGKPLKGYTEGKCDQCGITFWERTCDYNRNKEHFHTMDCYSMAKKGEKRDFRPWAKNKVPPKTYMDYLKEAKEREIRLHGDVSAEVENAIVFHEKHPTFLKKAAEVEDMCNGIMTSVQSLSMLTIAMISGDEEYALRKDTQVV